jgi:multicomponent Na+:H+ antiporter subunit G
VLEVIGIFRFGYVLNRMHASGIGDTMGLLLIVVALMIASGWNFTTLKLLLLIIFMWLTSPTSTHVLSMVEMNTNPYLDRYVRRREKT